jgi:hypothetical protein
MIQMLVDHVRRRFVRSGFVRSGFQGCFQLEGVEAVI